MGKTSCSASWPNTTREWKSLRRLTCTRWARRSEEHTSELQSRQYLVCRLLLEKKKTECEQIRNRRERSQYRSARGRVAAASGWCRRWWHRRRTISDGSAHRATPALWSWTLHG